MRRSLLSGEKSQICRCLGTQLLAVELVVHALTTADFRVATRAHQAFRLENLDVLVDLPVIDAYTPGHISRRISGRVLSHVADHRRPQRIGVEHIQGPSYLGRQLGDRFVNAGHSSILTHCGEFKSYQHAFTDDSITLKVMLIVDKTPPNHEEKQP